MVKQDKNRGKRKISNELAEFKILIGKAEPMLLEQKRHGMAETV